MSFSLTTPQIQARTKFVTRRLGWKNLKPGDLFQAVEKAQGLKKGEKVKPLGLLRCDSNHTEPLDAIVRPNNRRECILEGFPEMTPVDFVDMFCAHNKCEQFTPVQRIQFSYVIDANTTEGETLLNLGTQIEWITNLERVCTGTVIQFVDPYMLLVSGSSLTVFGVREGLVSRDKLTRIFISA